MKSRGAFGAVLVAVAGSLAGVGAARADGFQTVILRGDQVPGAPLGVLFDSPYPNLSIDQDGRVAFGGRLMGPGSPGEAFFAGNPAAIGVAARTGDPYPGTTMHYLTVSEALTRTGRLAGSFGLSNGGSINAYALVAGAPGALVEVARDGAAATQTEAGTTWYGLSDVVLNSRGDVAFTGNVIGPNVPANGSSGLWMGPVGAVSLRARSGTHAPGTGTGVNFTSIYGAYPPVLNSSGTFAFLAHLMGPGTTNANESGIWICSPPGEPTLAVRTGMPAPGTPAGVVFSRFIDVRINSAGQIALFSFVAGPGVTQANYVGIWTGTPGNLQLVARQGDPVPGFGPGVTYASFAPYRSPPIDAAGRVVFDSYIAGPGLTVLNNEVLWYGTPGSLVPIARRGDQAPGLPTGRNFRNIGPSFFPTDAGWLVFTAYVTRGSPLPDVQAVWGLAPGHLSPRALAVAGESITVRPGDSRQVQYFEPPNPTSTGTDDGQASLVNERGQVILGMSFIDSSRGVFVGQIGVTCYANCDGSSAVPVLNTNDFVCFMNRFATGDRYANCDGSSIAPVLNVSDFTCFLNRYAGGCS